MTKLRILLVVLILLVGLILRLHNYSVYPQRGATSDEYSYSFLGVSLLTKGVPVSWSAVSAYKHRSDLTIKNINFPSAGPAMLEISPIKDKYFHNSFNISSKLGIFSFLQKLYFVLSLLSIGIFVRVGFIITLILYLSSNFLSISYFVSEVEKI